MIKTLTNLCANMMHKTLDRQLKASHKEYIRTLQMMNICDEPSSRARYKAGNNNDY